MQLEILFSWFFFDIQELDSAASHYANKALNYPSTFFIQRLLPYSCKYRVWKGDFKQMAMAYMSKYQVVQIL